MVRKVYKLPQVILGVLAACALLLGAFAARSQAAFAASGDDVPGVEWNSGYSKCTVSERVSSIDLYNTLHNHRNAVQRVEFNGNGGILMEGSSVDWYSDHKVFANLEKLVQIVGTPSVEMGNNPSMNCMFYNCPKLQSVDLRGFNTTGISDMWGMFQGCNSLGFLDLSTFDTSSVANMGYMFSGCESLRALDLSCFQTNQVTNMRGMFCDCVSLSSLNTSGFDTSSVQIMGSAADWQSGGMFENCSSLTSLDLSNFNTEAVENMQRMFKGCTSLAVLNISNFYTRNESGMKNNTNMTYMFDDVDALNTLIVGPQCQLPESTKNLGPLATRVWFVTDATGTWQKVTSNVGIYQNSNPTDLVRTYIVSGWHADANGWRYLDSNGNWLNDGWHQIGSAWYYFQDTGYILTNGWYWLGGAWYGFWASGAMCQGWVFDNNYNDWFYCYDNGAMAANCWAWIGNAWYGFWANGTMCRGWIWDNGYGNWFYCDSYSGAMYQGCWAAIGGYWYGFWANGEMCYGWIWDGSYNDWYYCD